jgi:hypothetical protein
MVLTPIYMDHRHEIIAYLSPSTIAYVSPSLPMMDDGWWMDD